MLAPETHRQDVTVATVLRLPTPHHELAVSPSEDRRFADVAFIPADRAGLTLNPSAAPNGATASDPLAPLREERLGRELLRFVGGVLPEYLVPGFVVVLDVLPRLVNGKVDRGGLPVPGLGRRLVGSVFVGPRSEVEEDVAEVWREVLGLDVVGVFDDFFELGGHSLVAARVVARLRDRFGREVALRDVFEFPTVAGLAGRLGEIVGGIDDGVVAVGRDGVLPLSFAQQRLWFLDQLAPESAAYNVADAYRVRGRLDVGALSAALSDLVVRHEGLRTSFVMVGDRPAQLVGQPWRVEVEVESAPSGMDAVRWAVGVAEAEAVMPFDLTAGALFRARVLRVGADDHVVLLTMHHIVSDGWSMGVFVRELSERYGAHVAGVAGPMDVLEVQYADFAVWQRERLSGRVLEDHLAYWREVLAGAVATEVVGDRSRPAVQGFRGSMVRFAVAPEVAGRVRGVCRRFGVTPFMVFLAAFDVLLSRWTGSADVVVGAPVANRSRVEVEAVVGFFVNSLVLRTDLSGDPSFGQVLERVRDASLGAFAHEDLPFDRLVEEVAPQRDLSRNPLFQILFQMPTAPGGMDAPTIGRARVEDLDLPRTRSVVDLVLEVSERDLGWVGFFGFDSDLFDAETIERMAGHFGVILDAVTASPHLRLSEVPLLTADEQRRLAQWNATERPIDADSVIGQLDRWFAQTPDAVAVVHPDGSQLTYGELDERSARLASFLRAQGAGPETLVAIALERSASLVSTVVGVLRSGAAYVPLDPANPPRRLAQMLADACPAVLITSAQTAWMADHPDLQSPGMTHIDLDRDAVHIHSTPPQDLPQPAAHHLAYVIYTSGSTGTPKGIAMEHHAVSNLVLWEITERPSKCMLQFASLGFDVSFEEIFAMLCSGGTLVEIGEADRRDPIELARIMVEQRVQAVILPPVMLDAVAEVCLERAWVPDLVWVGATGETLVVTDGLRRFFGTMPNARLENHYGPSEAHRVSVQVLGPDPAEWPSLPSVGHPIWNARLDVVDPHGNLLPVGAAGELVVSGGTLARGYHGRPGLTADRFRPDANGPPGTRLYRIGDQARRLSDGAIQFLGRVDEQVKINGNRVEPGDIAHCLLAFGAVTDAVVVNIGSGAPKLHAYVVVSEEVATSELMAHVRNALPAYMIPAGISLVDRLVRNANGKVDRSVLPAPLPGPARSVSTPKSELERAIHAIWAEVLSVEPVDVDDNFFDVGGTSVLALAVRNRLVATVGRPVPMVVIFQYPTIRTLAAALSEDPATQELGTGIDTSSRRARLRRARGRA